MNINAPLPTHIPPLRSLWHHAFGDTEKFLNDFFQTAFHPDHCRYVYADGKIVAMLYWFDCLHRNKPIAYLYAIATDISYRGQGICHALMTDTHRHLSQLGYKGALLVPGNRKLFDFYENMGYQTSCYIREFSCENALKAVPLSQITKIEYAKLRRQLLPLDGVIQENENLDFLQTQTQFYAGANFLLAAHKEKDCLFGVELLGDTAAASGIVQALGCQKGTFRTPGEEIPFAMYYPLGNDTLKPPCYFGIAFD